MSVGEKTTAVLSRVLTSSREPNRAFDALPGALLHPVRSRDDDSGAVGEPEGFTIIGLMMAIAIINIGLAVALTSWATINKRAKETELIWRGQQYVRALRCHQAATGALPDDLDDLVESDCIRAVYPDPMSPDGEWRIIRESDLRFSQGRTGFGATRSAGAVLDSIDRELRGPEAFFGNTGAPAGGAPPESLEAAFLRLQNLSQRLSQSFASGSGNGIVGVVSTSTDEALRLYKGETTYDAWRFLAR